MHRGKLHAGEHAAGVVVVHLVGAGHRGDGADHGHDAHRGDDAGDGDSVGHG